MITKSKFPILEFINILLAAKVTIANSSKIELLDL